MGVGMRINIKKTTIIICSVLLFSQFICSATENGQKTSQVTPSSKHYEFGTVPEGTIVKHVYDIINKSDVVLNLGRPQASCSCLTIDDYDQQIPSDSIGTVSISFSTDGYGNGERIFREVKFDTSDPNMPQLTLEMAGVVEKVYRITPRVGNLTGKATDNIQTTILILPEERYPFNVLGAKAKKGRDIAYAIKEIEQNGRKGFALTIKSIRKDKGLFSDKIYLRTDSNVVPEISIGVFGKIEGA